LPYSLAMSCVEHLRVCIHMAYARPVRHWPHRPAGASLAVSPWAICLRADADQYLTALVMVVQNKRTTRLIEHIFNIPYT